MVQLQLNQGPQDALLYDNTRSYFTNVGYVRTSNFQMELRDVDPQNTATLGSTIQFVIPKAADLLGPVDLMMEFTRNDVDLYSATLGEGESGFVGWVESLGFAAIDKVVFSVGSHDIETMSGDQLYIMNELMRDSEQRYGREQILKTGRPLVRATCDGTKYTPLFESDASHPDNGSRLIAMQYDEIDGSAGADIKVNPVGKKLIIPLNCFFTKHPSQYFPIAAIAGCNDIRFTVKTRSLAELLVMHTSRTVASGLLTDVAADPAPAIPKINIATGTCKLRCHYVHVTGPEASLLMNKEHVRLLKLWQNHNVTSVIPHEVKSLTDPPSNKRKLFDFELPFLHPVAEMIIVIRKTSEMSNSLECTTKPGDYDQKARTKNYFAFHGGNKDPNIESIANSTAQSTGTLVNTEAYLQVEDFKLTLNGQERHPSLASSGLDRHYLMNRLMPLLHSNTSSTFKHVHDTTYGGSDASDVVTKDMQALSEMMDRKEIYVYPFSLNPEGANPAGAVNFSKVSHAKCTIEGYAKASSAANIEYRCDVWGVHYNWLQIKDGRAITSFS